ncbi:MAG: type II toxin-antitoxin system YafQ family toxin [Ectothiorhodospiraceae bacterium]|nr:type II toxin-antitoxin system YafQ family toxin [Ectothiorhodospiraceae bacterium]
MFHGLLFFKHNAEIIGASDLVLIYKVDSKILKIARIGSHSELFQ